MREESGAAPARARTRTRLHARREATRAPGQLNTQHNSNKLIN